LAHRILIILQREYLTRIRKKSFVLASLLAPLFMLIIYTAPYVISELMYEQLRILVIDESLLFHQKFIEERTVHFIYTIQPTDLPQNEIIDATIHIPYNVLEKPQNIQLFTQNNLSASVLQMIKNTLELEISRHRLEMTGISKSLYDSIEVEISLQPIVQQEANTFLQGQSAFWLGVLGLGAGTLIYLFIFMYSSQVMRSVVEEKTGRIIEVMFLMVKPIELMFGKILGVACVALTQMTVWLIVIAVAFFTLNTSIAQASEDVKNQSAIAQTVLEFQQSESFNQWGLLLFCFGFYFIMGYLIYASIFASLGALADNDSEINQLAIVVTSPLVISIISAGTIISYPNNMVVIFLSMFPLTSPIVMMMRLPFEVPTWEILLSMFLLVAGFLVITYAAASFYKSFILMYGKKIRFRDIIHYFLT